MDFLFYRHYYYFSVTFVLFFPLLLLALWPVTHYRLQHKYQFLFRVSLFILSPSLPLPPLIALPPLPPSSPESNFGFPCYPSLSPSSLLRFLFVISSSFYRFLSCLSFLTLLRFAIDLCFYLLLSRSLIFLSPQPFCLLSSSPHNLYLSICLSIYLCLSVSLLLHYPYLLPPLL